MISFSLKTTKNRRFLYVLWMLILLNENTQMKVHQSHIIYEGEANFMVLDVLWIHCYFRPCRRNEIHKYFFFNTNFSI